MASMLLGLGADMLGLNLVTSALQLAFFHWQRCSELSCDRAAAIYMDGYQPVAQVMSLLASGSRELSSRINMELYMKQAEEYRSFMEHSNWNKLLQYYALMSQKHPFLSVRALNIREWCESRVFEDIMNYKYERNPASIGGGEVCPACGSHVEKDWGFCRNCGRKL